MIQTCAEPWNPPLSTLDAVIHAFSTNKQVFSNRLYLAFAIPTGCETPEAFHCKYSCLKLFQGLITTKQVLKIPNTSYSGSPTLRTVIDSLTLKPNPRATHSQVASAMCHIDFSVTFPPPLVCVRQSLPRPVKFSNSRWPRKQNLYLVYIRPYCFITWRWDKILRNPTFLAWPVERNEHRAVAFSPPCWTETLRHFNITLIRKSEERLFIRSYNAWNRVQQPNPWNKWETGRTEHTR